MTSHSGKLQFYSLHVSSINSAASEEDTVAFIKTVLEPIFRKYPAAQFQFFRKNNKVTAVISGIRTTMDEVNATYKGQTFQNLKLLFKPDDGAERTDEGDRKFKNSRACTAFQEAMGNSLRKCQVFNDSFLDSIDENLLLPTVRKDLYLDTINLNDKVLAKPGTYVFKQRYKESGKMHIVYQTLFETYQAIRYLNRNVDLSRDKPSFIAENHSCMLEICSGLGVKGKVVKVDYTGIIRLDAVDPSIIISKNMMKLKCYKCKTLYNMFGFEANLKYLVGKCKCIYDSTLDVEDKKKAIFTGNESFTRIIMDTSDKGTKQLYVYHEPMTGTFPNGEEMRRVTLPVICSQWEMTEQEMASHTMTNVKLSTNGFTLVGEDNAKSTKTFGAEISILNPDKFWLSATTNEIKLCIISVPLETNEDKCTADFKVDVLSIKKSSAGNVHARIRFKVEGCVEIKHGVLSIAPIPDYSEFSKQKRLLNKIAKQYDKTNTNFNSPLLGFVLNSKFDSLRNHKYVPLPQLLPEFNDIYSKLLTNLNPAQLSAVQHAMNEYLTLLQGPPGTGKTTTIVAMSYAISIRDTSGKILVCAPSNATCNAIAKRFESFNKSFGKKQKPMIVRVFCKTAAALSIRDNTQYSFPTLHEAVLAHKDLKDERLQTVIHAMRNGTDHLISDETMDYFHHTVEQLEKQITKKFQIFIMTLGALPDTEEKSFFNFSNIKTVILDEAGQVTQPNALQLIKLNPDRFIFCGDKDQLKPTIVQPSCQMAKLDVSQLEWFFIHRRNPDSTIKWHVLNQQYRSVPQIRSFVSKFTYDNQLIDFNTLSHRDYHYAQNVRNAFPPASKHAILHIDHDGEESDYELSKQNIEEVAKVKSIVKHLRFHGVPANDMTILTFYDGQKKMLMDQLKNEDVGVFNVDEFQGGENKIVIISFVRANKRSLGFLKNQNRLNVAVSRAQFFLFIVFNDKLFITKNNSTLISFHSLVQSHATKICI